MLCFSTGATIIIPMKKEAFQYIAEDNILILDGATGSFLLAAGMPADACSEDWVLHHPDVLIDLQKQYVSSGSDIIYAPTFTANRAKLSEHGFGDEIRQINRQLVELSREAAGSKALVAGDLSMTSSSIVLFEDDEYNEIKEIYREQIKALADAGCDLLIVETMLSLTETLAAVEAATEVCDLPIMASLTFEQNGRTLYGDAPGDCAKALSDAGAAVVGANCSTGPDRMLPIIEEMRGATDLPILAKPNAGLPMPGPNGTIKYDLTDDTFAVSMMAIIEAGANFIGGCCGTSPSYIEKLHCLAQNMAFTSRKD